VSFRRCDGPLAAGYDAAFLDLDGVVYVGPDPVPSAPASIESARSGGLRVMFVTNNASRTPDAIARHLTEIGVPAAAGDVVTSAQAVGRMLVELVPSGSDVLVVGGPGLWAEVSAAGMHPVEFFNEASPPHAVVQGYTADMGYPRLAEAALAVRAGAVWIASNVDSTMPSPRGLLPGNGALVAAVRVATGREPTVAGKPFPPLHREAVRRSGARNPLVVGDRLDTDIQGAVATGTDSLLVLSGVTDLAGLAAATADTRPTYLGADISALLEPAPSVRVDSEAGAASCGGARAAVVDAVWHLDGSGLDLARAACALAWARADAGRPLPDLGALSRLSR